MTAYYNEIDPFVCDWLEELIRRDLIAPGDVDRRSIVDVKPDDLRGYTQCHFFAGIGVWSYALRLAGAGDDEPVWTGSCPCQPFSAAGRQKGTADGRHLWPAWFNLVRQRAPERIYFEQVEAAIKLGWLDAVQNDLEGIGYAVGSVVLPAAGVGAPHARHRIFGMADHHEAGRRELRRGGLLDGERAALGHDADGRGGVGDDDDARLERLAGHGDNGHEPGWLDAHAAGPTPTSGFWRDPDWIYCRDGKYRPVEPGTFPLAHGAPARVGRLRAYGNAIVAQVAAEFIKASYG